MDGNFYNTSPALSTRGQNRGLYPPIPSKAKLRRESQLSSASRFCSSIYCTFSCHEAHRTRCTFIKLCTCTLLGRSEGPSSLKFILAVYEKLLHIHPASRNQHLNELPGRELHG
ncbi:hypothetical protein PAXRUDRAFT_823960 [Paxillus rubicundulus Ve08.2h10]|uniref:Unplaced genomic scaffold scaffold_74, whole genome shotgun sequence n=1 Tax=Paxillus rubicundulus Ve08.2h10 TaxID=930991 RepID=A0A0D0DJ10_9AGAM|nr:hypothetical protein PAXRUDRAFT_823960 [Paxillus rubicundulus Ve08.2h10]